MQMQQLLGKFKNAPHILKPFTTFTISPLRYMSKITQHLPQNMLNESYGLDHGSWCVITPMHPEAEYADISVIHRDESRAMLP